LALADPDSSRGFGKLALTYLVSGQETADRRVRLRERMAQKPPFFPRCCLARAHGKVGRCR